MPSSPTVRKAPGTSCIDLPPPAVRGMLSLDEALRERRSVRRFRDAALALQEVSHLLWAAQGITDPTGLRTAPSAGALYPLELYLLAGRIADLPAGTYHYQPHAHVLTREGLGDRRALIAAAADQPWIAAAAACLVITAIYERATRVYGQQAGERLVHIEAGHVAQNVYLEIETLGLGTTTVGEFSESAVRSAIAPGTIVTPLCLLPIGRI